MNQQMTQNQVINGSNPPIGNMMNGGQLSNSRVIVNTLPISPVRPISSGPMPNSEYFPNQNIPTAIAAGAARPQSAYLQNGQQQQVNFAPNIPGAPSPF